MLGKRSDGTQGWAVAPEQGKPHQLSLLLDAPLDLKQGVLRVRIDHASVHPQHVLDRFRFAMKEFG